MPRPNSLEAIITEAVADLTRNGFDSAERVAYWSARIREAAEKMAIRPEKMDQMLRDALASVYKTMIDKGGITKWHPGIGRFTLEKVRPALRNELDKRIMASANLIRLNKEEAIEKTIRRFQGWATSIPTGGTKATDKPEIKKDLNKAIRDLPFVERRVLIDQGHKLRASLSEVLANDGGAIAMIWHSRWRQPGYDYRPDHKERDLNVYLLRDSWALKQGLVKPGEHGYYDKITSVAEEPFCRCSAEWIYNLRDLPRDMLTKKGLAALEEARKKVKEMFA